ncbi:MAG TPA: DUF3179 domain-containing protein [Acidimicrobiia bacterium]|nr:DUF3179 domain-containing protein [Acidimicrobiia bacterium]
MPFHVPLRLHVIVLVAALAVAACSSSEPGAEPDTPSTRASSPGSTAVNTTSDTGEEITTSTTAQEVPDVDTSLHSVPLDLILFDTFDGRAVALTDSTPELRGRLLDAIPPIDDPVYQDSADGDWLQPDDLVLGYVTTEQAYAYPFKILNYHEIANDDLAGVPVLISYCPLCRSGIVYDRRVDGQVLEFGNTSALYESDLVMVDRSTGSYWWQVPGEAIVGPLTGTKLTSLPSRVARWDDWKQLHPDTKVLSRDTGYDRPYDNDPFTIYPDRIDQGQFPFPLGDTARDDRLPASTLVVGVEIGDVNRVYALPLTDGAVNDIAGGTPVVLLTSGDGASAGVFSPVVDGVALEFDQTSEGYIDDQTQSLWTATGAAVDGPLQGRQLSAIPSRTTFWFAYIAAFPNSELYTH